MRKFFAWLLSLCLLVGIGVIFTACDNDDLSNEEIVQAGFEKSLETYKAENIEHTYEGITVRYAMYDGYSGGNIQILGNTYDENTAQLIEGYVFYCFSDYYYQGGEEQLTSNKLYKYDIKNETVTPLGSLLFYHTDPEEEFTEVLYASKLILMFADYSTGVFELTNEYAILDKRNTDILYDLDDGENFYTISKASITSEEFEIPATHNGKPVGAIGKEAFKDSVGLKKVTVPASITCIGQNAFNCSSIEEIVIAENSQLKIIEESAFANTKIQKITIPEEVEYIGYRAFGNCLNLTEIKFNAKNCADFVFEVTEYGETRTKYGSVFGASDSVVEQTSVTIGKSVEKVPSHFFNNYKTNKLTVVFEENSDCTVIGKNSFYSQPLEVVVFPEKLEIIGDNAFYKTGLKTITIPSTVKNIGDCAFYDCTSLETIIFAENSTLERIGISSFEYCTSLKKIDVPASTQSISAGAFAFCDALESITLPFVGSSADGNDTFGYIFWEGNSSSAFEMNGSSRAYQYQFDGSEKFYYVPMSLKYVKINSDYIPYGAFSNCQYIENIEIGSNTKVISEKAFNGCYALREFVIPSSVTTIGAYAFYACDELTKLIIPKSVETIGRLAFEDYYVSDYCIYYEGNENQWNTIIASHESYISHRVYYYAELSNTDGKHWHYDTDGKTPVLW